MKNGEDIMTERFMVDDAGTLIDMRTRDMFDIVEEVVDLLNELHEENTTIKQTLSNMIATERTHIGKNILIQLQEAIQ